MKKNILYVSTNDGSDTRINKEIKSLAKSYNIIYLGVGKHSTINFAKSYCSEFHLINGIRNHPVTIIKQIVLFLKLLITKKIHSVHVINEQLMIFFYPFLFFKHTVLDVFDSIFLRWNKPKNKWKFLKKFIYAPVNKIIVTDENRKKLMPEFLSSKIEVIQNYPYLGKTKPVKKNDNRPLTIFYFGTLNKSRGTEFLIDLLSLKKPIKIMMAGWITDKITEKLIEYDNVEYLKVLNQNQVSELASKNADYILCLYEPNNSNNINASPNKIYDAIQTQTPVIINNEILVSDFVKKNNVGVIIPSYYSYDTCEIYNTLQQQKNNFTINEKLKSKFSWESIENKLLKTHEKK